MNDMMKWLKKLWMDIAVFTLIASCIAYMHLCNGWTSLGVFWLCEFCTFIVFDTTIILLGAYVISLGRRRLAYSLAFTVTLFWTLLNVYYYRFFNQYFNFRDFGEAKNLKDGVVWDSIFSAIAVSDIFLLVVIALFVFLIIKMKSERITFVERIKRLKMYALLPLAMIVVYGTERVLMDATLAIRDSEQKAKLLQGWDYTDKHKRNIQHRGLFCGQLYDDAIVTREDKELLAEEKTFVEQYCQQLRDKNRFDQTESSNEMPKNIVFILLESALSCPIGKNIDGVEVTPNLNALLRESGTYYNRLCRGNIGIGESFDGQFIYHTGLLPLTGKLTSTFVVDNELKALPLFLKEQYGTQEAIMAIPTGPDMWRQNEMCRLYGYDILLSASNVGKTIGDGGQWLNLNDSILVNLLINNIDELSLKKQFLHTILTMSTHGPYDVAEHDMDMPTLPTYSLQMNNYLKHYHYTDRQLGRYFQFLKSKGVYDNSIIVIVSDHTAHTQYLNMSKEQIGNEYLPFIIAHANIDSEKCWHGEMNQLDVFTTILDLLDLEADWHGLGSSVLDKDNYTNRLNETTQRVSDLIIESNYWKRED